MASKIVASLGRVEDDGLVGRRRQKLLGAASKMIALAGCVVDDSLVGQRC